MSYTYYNKSGTLRLILDSELLGSYIETFWVLERKKYVFGVFPSWERLCEVDRTDLDKCKNKHKLKPSWERVEGR